jgi:hypothetical protein
MLKMSLKVWKKKSDSEDSDDEESRHNELEEFQNSNVDCASGDITFINDSDEIPHDDQSPATICAVDASKDTAKGDRNEIEVR